MGHQIKTWRCCCCLKVVDLSPPRVWAGGEQMMQIWAKRPQPNKRTSTTNCFHHLLHIYSLEVNIQNEIQQGSRSGHSAMIFVCSDKPWFFSPENMIFDQNLINQSLDQIKTCLKVLKFSRFSNKHLMHTVLHLNEFFRILWSVLRWNLGKSFNLS